MRRLFPLLLLLSLVARADDPSPEQLEALKERIRELTSAQNQDLERRDDLQAKLRDTEKRIGTLGREQRHLDREVQDAEQRLAETEQRQAELAAEKKVQLSWLARTVRASYQAGREERIKLLLNQEDPERVARLLRYQEYFQRARRDRLVNLEGELVDLRQVAREVADARANLLDRRTALARHRQELEAAGREREKALAALGQSLENRGGQLNSLRADQQRLERLLEQMRQAAEQAARESAPSGPSRPAARGGTPFGKLAGGLPWPVRGPLLTSYNSRREGELRWTGVILGVDEGTPVQAVHPGRVVFADWLRGFGLLIILDHGDGYLTLYGYNQSLLRQVGDQVATGDVLSLAGRSGGNSRSALYFEIRHRGKAVNPARWCDRRVTLPPIARNN